MIQLSTEKPNLDETKVGNGAPKRKTKEKPSKNSSSLFQRTNQQ